MTEEIALAAYPLEEYAARLAANDIPQGGLSAYDAPGWFANFAAACLEKDEIAALHEARSAAGVALFPLRARRRGLGPLSFRVAGGLSNFYSCAWRPIGLGAVRDSGEATALVAAWGRFARAQYRPHLLRFDALDEADGLKALIAGLGQAGYWVELFPQFGNWRKDFAGASFDLYWAARPSRLKNTIARNEKKLRAAHHISIQKFSHARQTDEAIKTFREVSARGWQKGEPYPDFLPGLIRYGLEAGDALVWSLRADGRPIAAQIWLGRHRDMTIFKLAHDQDFAAFSPGSLLTKMAIEAELDDKRLYSLDFGWGDDAYKRDWLPDRVQKFGLRAYDPSTVKGFVLALRNLGPKFLRARLKR